LGEPLLPPPGPRNEHEFGQWDVDAVPVIVHTARFRYKTNDNVGLLEKFHDEDVYFGAANDVCNELSYLTRASITDNV
jgi:hypothetical protein